MAPEPLTTPRLRLALTLPGAVSLGAYHGGALAALLVAAQHSDGQLIIDAMATASAGALTGVLAARALLRGADPVGLMTKAWVEADSLGALRSHDTRSVLDPEPLRVLAADLLAATGSVPDGAPATRRQTDPVRLSMALASLGGLAYRLPSLDSSQPWVNALTHLDWWNHTFGADDDFGLAVDPALASAANALGFPPSRLDRSADRAQYEANHVIAPPVRPDRPRDEQWMVWYTDGGTLDNQPFGRAIDLVVEAEADPAVGDEPTDERLFVLVEPQPATVDFDGRWWDPETHPRWTFTLFDVFNLRGEQSVYDDLLQLEKTNSRVRWNALAAEAVTEALETAMAAVDPAQRPAVEDAVRRRLGGAASTMDDDHRRLEAHHEGKTVAPGTADAAPAEPLQGDLATAVSDLLARASGLSGKRPARVEMVSPLLDGDATPVSDRLAGDFLFHFGGFVDEEFRRHDFLVGWSNMRTWLATRADRHGFSPALDEVDRRHAALGWTLEECNPTLSSLDLHDKWELTRTAGHVGHVIAHDLADLVGHDDDR